MYELWRVEPRWASTSHAELLIRIRSTDTGSLIEGVSLPIEVSHIDYLPDLIDPDRDYKPAEDVQLLESIRLAIKRVGIWRQGPWAVTRARADD